MWGRIITHIQILVPCLHPFQKCNCLLSYPNFKIFTTFIHRNNLQTGAILLYRYCICIILAEYGMILCFSLPVTYFGQCGGTILLGRPIKYSNIKPSNVQQMHVICPNDSLHFADVVCRFMSFTDKQCKEQRYNHPSHTHTHTHTHTHVGGKNIQWWKMLGDRHCCTGEGQVKRVSSSKQQ